MKPKEAIQIIERILDPDPWEYINWSDKAREALEMAIEALDHFRDDTKKIDGDLVSRKYLLAEYDRQHVGQPGGARKIIENAPSVESESDWKPYKDDNIPYGEYLVQSKNGNIYIYTGIWTDWGWQFEHYVPRVVAYRPLPEKYKGDE